MNKITYLFTFEIEPNRNVPSVFCRYAISFQAINAMGTKSEFGIDNFSMSPQCFGLGVPKKALDDWQYNMTDTELCKYYGK